MGRRVQKVMGIHAPAPRVTGAAIWLAVRYIGLPLLALLILFDVVVWFVFQQVWGVCVGVWCWF